MSDSNLEFEKCLQTKTIDIDIESVSRSAIAKREIADP
jgi:hypothetical protein